MKSVVITGSSSDIGLAGALMLDRNGFRVFAGVRKEADGDALRAVASESLTPVHIDVTDAASIQAMADRVRAKSAMRGCTGWSTTQALRCRVRSSTSRWPAFVISWK